MAGFANPYGAGGHEGSMEQRKKQLLAHIMSGRPGSPASSAVRSGGRALTPGAHFGQQAHFSNPLAGILQAHGSEQFGNLAPQAVGASQAAPQAFQGAPIGGGAGAAPYNASSDTGGMSHMMPSGGGPLPTPPPTFGGGGITGMDPNIIKKLLSQGPSSYFGGQGGSPMGAAAMYHYGRGF